MPAAECLAARGAVLAFRPLLLHASSPARVARQRRVLHIEYAAPVLDVRLAWDGCRRRAMKWYSRAVI